MADALIVLHGDSSLGVSERDMESEDRLSIHTHTHTHTHTHSDTLGKCFNQYVEKNSMCDGGDNVSMNATFFNELH